MFKATHKGRATTLSKALFTAGLLGGAALSTLSAGSAQAAGGWAANPVGPTQRGYTCTFGSTAGTNDCATNFPTPTTVAVPGVGPGLACDPSGILHPCDKILTLLDWGLANGTSAIGNQAGIADGSTLVFEYQPPDIHPWHVDVDLAGNDLDGGFLGYTLVDTDPNWVLSSAYLAAQAPAGSVTKDIYSSLALYQAAAPGNICRLTTLGTQCDFSGVSQIWVRDTWTATSAGVDNFANDYQQTPAPLPLLGVGAVFGSIRKLRKFSSQLKTFSMS
jgi:hypothetical protein